MTQDWNQWFTSLYGKMYGRLYRVAYRLTGDTETAKELVHDAFVWVIVRQEKLEDHPNPEGWLMQTLLFQVKNANRRLLNREISLETQLYMPAPKRDRGLDEILPLQLSEEDREVLIWRFEQQMDYGEIANRLGLTETGSRSRVFRALNRCRKLLGYTKEEK